MFNNIKTNGGNTHRQLKNKNVVLPTIVAIFGAFLGEKVTLFWTEWGKKLPTFKWKMDSNNNSNKKLIQECGNSKCFGDFSTPAKVDFFKN